MKKKITIQKKIILILIIIFFLSILIIIPYVLNKLSTIEVETLSKAVNDFKTELKSSLLAKKKVWMTNALQIANNPIIEEAMFNGDRDKCINILKNYDGIYKKNTGFQNVKFHLIDKDLKSFVKSWKINSHGEELSYSDAYKDVKNSKKAMVTLEVSSKGLRLKGLFPVFYNTKFTGIVNFEGGLDSIKRTLIKNKIHFLYFLHNDYLSIGKSIKDNQKYSNYILSQKDVNNEFLEHIINEVNIIDLKDKYCFDDKYLISMLSVKSLDGKELGIYLLGQKRELVTKTLTKNKSLVLNIIILFLIMFLICIIVLTLAINKIIIKPIKSILEIIKNLENGDLTQKIEIQQKDEIGQLGNFIQEMSDNLLKMIKGVKLSSESVASGSLQISSSTEELAATVEQQSAQSTSVSTAVQELSATSNEISVSVDDTLEIANNSSQLTKDGSSIIQESIDSFETIQRQTDNLKDLIGNLGNSTDKIGNIIEVINDVADQTNLLALNAAIEAARAGDAGRGFAVVADEVRKLAERTAKATKEIEEIIRALQKESGMAAKAMEDTSKEVANGTELGHKSLEILQNIVSFSDRILDATTSVASAVTEENATIEEIRNNIDGIATASSESANAVSEVATTSEDLSRQAENLKTMVDKFKTE